MAEGKFDYSKEGISAGFSVGAALRLGSSFSLSSSTQSVDCQLRYIVPHGCVRGLGEQGINLRFAVRRFAAVSRSLVHLRAGLPVHRMAAAKPRSFTRGITCAPHGSSGVRRNPTSTTAAQRSTSRVCRNTCASSDCRTCTFSIKSARTRADAPRGFQRRWATRFTMPSWDARTASWQSQRLARRV